MYMAIKLPRYCSECRHFWPGDYDDCRIIDGTKSDWHSKNRFYFKPEKQNANNQCQHWEHKRTFIEWLNDLIN